MLYNTIIAVIIESEETTEIISLEEAKLFCKVDLSDDDTTVSSLIKAAVHILEKHLNTSLIGKSITAKISNGLGDCYLPYGPVKEITAMTDCGNDVDVALSGGFPGVIAEPRSQTLVVKYTTGFDPLPEAYRTAILEQIFFMYNNREEQMSVAPAALLTTSGLCRPNV